MSGLYSDLDNRIFLGKNIKLGFPAVNPQSGKTLIEFIKIKVSHQVSTDVNSELVGVILEESNFISEYKLGDVVAFSKNEITEMCSEGSC